MKINPYSLIPAATAAIILNACGSDLDPNKISTDGSNYSSNSPTKTETSSTSPSSSSTQTPGCYDDNLIKPFQEEIAKYNELENTKKEEANNLYKLLGNQRSEISKLIDELSLTSSNLPRYKELTDTIAIKQKEAEGTSIKWTELQAQLKNLRDNRPKHPCDRPISELSPPNYLKAFKNIHLTSLRRPA